MSLGLLAVHLQERLDIRLLAPLGSSALQYLSGLGIHTMGLTHGVYEDTRIARHIRGWGLPRGQQTLMNIGRRLAFDRLASREIESIVRLWKPDVVHTNNSLHFNLSDIEAAGRADCLVVCHVRQVHRPSRHEVSVARGSVDMFITPSAAAATAYEQGGVQRDRILVLPNPVDLAAFERVSDASRVQSRCALGVDKTDVLVVCVGRLVRLKGTHILVRAISVLREQGVPVKLVVVGDGPEKERLEGMASTLNLKACVRFVGYQRHVLNWLRCSDILVQPSITADTFPRSVIEAMAVGLPVVGTRVGGIPEAVEDQITGFVVEPGSVDDLASALQKIATDTSVRANMGAVARQRALDRFRPEEYALRVSGVYDRLLTGVVPRCES